MVSRSLQSHTLIMTRYLKHTIHVTLLYSFLALAQWATYMQIKDAGTPEHKNVVSIFGLILLILQMIVLLPIPQLICELLGLTLFNAFPGDININLPSREIVSPMSNGDCSPEKIENATLQKNGVVLEIANTRIETVKSIPLPIDELITIPHLCFRVVTRGLYPELVQNNVRSNLMTCIESGLTNFSIEIVTDVDIHMSEQDDRIRQIVVPIGYESSTRARFKARALQYALEPGTSPVQDEDYVVHLDEETIITKNVINGIINFALDGKHAFGQGVITYANIGIVNLFTTLADSFRVADDMGKIQFTLGALHRPIFGWKGSFVVTRCDAEKDVSFDHGENGSIAEDCYFSMIAYKKGYTFNFIQGEMYEKSPFTLMDLIRQRKRWLQGIWLVVGSSNIPWKTKIFLAISLYSWLTLPITSLSLINIFVEVPCSYYLRPFGTFCFSMTVYMYLFGLVKSIDLKNRPVSILITCVIAQLLTIGLYSIVENIVVIWGVFSNKHTFYIVKKDRVREASDGKSSLIAKF